VTIYNVIVYNVTILALLGRLRRTAPRVGGNSKKRKYIILYSKYSTKLCAIDNREPYLEILYQYILTLSAANYGGLGASPHSITLVFKKLLDYETVYLQKPLVFGPALLPLH
jgi:hypothetical protein